MTKKSAKQIRDENLQILGAFIHEIVSMRNRFADFVAKWELYGELTRNEAEFMNEISIACQKYLDTEHLIAQKSKKRGKNGNLGQ